MKSIFPAKPKSKLTSATLKVNEEEISNKESIHRQQILSIFL